MSIKMIQEAQLIANLKKSRTYDNVKALQRILGISLQEAADMYRGQFDKSISPSDYEEWLQQVVLQAENLRRSGAKVSLNKKAVFADLVGEILENDPAGKVQPGTDQFSAVVDVLWKKYQTAKSEVRAQNLQRQREEEEEQLNKRTDLRIDDLIDDDCDDWNEDDPFFDEREYTGLDGEYEDEESNIMVGPDPELDGYEKTDHLDADDTHYGVDAPYEEGTPEYDAWMLGFEAALDEIEGLEDEDDVNDENFDDPGDLEGDEIEVDRPNFEDEESSYYNLGREAARKEYHGTGVGGRLANRERRQHPEWERGYEDFMGDTEGQRELQRHVVSNGQEDEEKVTLKSMLTAPRETINKAVKDVEVDGARAFHGMKLPNNPHPDNSMANKAWARGFKNAAKDGFGFADKPTTQPKKTTRKK